MANLPRRKHLERRGTGMTRYALKSKSRSGMAMWDGLWPTFVALPVPPPKYRLSKRFVYYAFKKIWLPAK
jgi:hypothetical protein